MTDKKKPNLMINICPDKVATCGICGERNYEEVRSKIVELDVVMYELRTCSNGVQDTITRVCKDCLHALRGATGIILGGQNNVSYTKAPYTQPHFETLGDTGR